MLKQIVVVGACILALMVVVKDGRALHVAGLRGSCSIAGTYRDSSLLVACRAGRLDGRIDLVLTELDERRAAALAESLGAGQALTLQKPYSPDRLRRALRHALDK